MMKFYWRLVFSLVLTLTLVSTLLAQNTNILANPGVEIREPNFWSTVNNGLGGAECIWASDTAVVGTNPYSFKVVKASTTTDAVGWKSVNNAKLYWHNVTAGTIDLKYFIKTSGVNTDPTTDDAKIGVKYTYYAGGNLIGEKFVTVDQTAADMDWHEVTDAIIIASDPEEVYAEIMVGKDATGTVWFDNISGSFNGSAATPVGWLNWTSGGDIGFADVVPDTAHTGDYSVLLKEEDDNADEMVFYSQPVPAVAGEWYMISVWMKSEDIDTSAGWHATNITPDRDVNRMGINFFFHKPPIDESFDLVGGDQFFYIDQRPGKEREDWTLYKVIVQAPEETAGVSMRARFNPDVKGSVWYDDFSIEKLELESNILDNAGVEIREPNFWSTVNNGLGGAECIWASDTAVVGTNPYSFKVVKASTTTDAVGWKSVNNAKLYWHNVTAGTIDLKYFIKTSGVNTDPTTDDAKIGVKYTYYAGGNLIGEKFVTVDQTAADMDWHEVTDAIIIASDPEEVYAEIMVGKDATGTVWFDNISGSFNGSAATPVGWLNWTSGGDIGFADVVPDTAHTGDYSVLLKEEDDNADEMVFYSQPVPAVAGEWYMISVWMKSEDIDTSAGWHATNITPDRDVNRMGINFFFHKPPIDESFDLVGGDQFFYIDQRPGKEREDWTLYKVIVQAPEETAGVSMRARFNPDVTGSVWYDDFGIQNVQILITAIEHPTNQIAIMPAEYELFNNYPNPFNPETIIEYKVPITGQVKMAIYNVLGQNVRTLVDVHQPAGTYMVMWDGKDNHGNKLSSGVYFYQLIGENALITRKMTLLK